MYSCNPNLPNPSCNNNVSPAILITFALGILLFSQLNIFKLLQRFGCNPHHYIDGVVIVIYKFSYGRHEDMLLFVLLLVILL